MGVYLADVIFWVREWATSGEPISEAVARTIASYWVGAPGPLAEFALGLPVERDPLLDDLAEHIRYVRSAHVWEDTATELYALKAWVEAS